MGVSSKNAPKVIGSSILGGGAAVLSTNVMGPVLEAMGGFMEGGAPEVVNYKE